MKCENCGKDLPETLNYCPTCKIRENKDLASKSRRIEKEQSGDSNEIVQQALVTEPEKTKEVKVFTKKWDITLYYLLISLAVVLVLSYVCFPNAKINPLLIGNTLERIICLLVTISIYSIYALYVDNYLLRTYLWIIYSAISFVIYLLTSLLCVGIIIIEGADIKTSYFSLLFYSFIPPLLFLPFKLINYALNK